MLIRNSLIIDQVSGFLEGERDYSNLKGDTGPLVYPAGFLYVYSAIQYITGGEVYSAQVGDLVSPCILFSNISCSETLLSVDI